MPSLQEILGGRRPARPSMCFSCRLESLKEDVQDLGHMLDDLRATLSTTNDR